MRIVSTGNYEPGYNRNHILLKGLKAIPTIELLEHPTGKGKPYPSSEILDSADFIFLPSFTHADVRAIKKISKTPLVFDPLISRYLTKVFDYKQVKPWSPRALKNYLKDYRPMQACDLLLADTQAHADYYSRTFNISRSKIAVLPIGVDTEEFRPATRSEDRTFRIGFYGGFIPLQGTEVILRTAKLLLDEPDLHFELIGNGYEYDKMIQLSYELRLRNLSFKGWLKKEELPMALEKFDLCLGIFGKTRKTDLVIPNKLFHYAAKGIPFITKETAALKEVFQPGYHCSACEAKPESLRDAILEMKEDTEKRKTFAENSLQLMREEYNHLSIARMFLIHLDRFKLTSNLL